MKTGWFESLLEETDFLQRYPFFAGVIARMEPVAANTIPVMAVCLRRWHDPKSRLKLLVNTAYCDEHPEFVAGVLRHEINHVILGHLTNQKYHSVAQPKIMELAMELSANEGISEPLPEGGFFIKAFLKFGIREGQSTLERYRLLKEAHENGELNLQDYWSPRMHDTHRPRQCEGRETGAGIGDVLDARSDGASERNWNRNQWGLGAPSSEFELNRMKEAIARHLGGDRGGPDDPQNNPHRRPVAKELQRILLDSGTGPVVDWRRVLREAFPRRRQVFPDYLRPNRRFTDRVGEVPGRRRRPPKPRLLAGIDTSGSMPGEALDRISRELRELARHAHITVVECDAVVQRIYPLSGPTQSFVGGGDTDFAPVFAEANDPAIEGLVYFTDGKGSLAELPAVPTLWALTNNDPFYPESGMIIRL